MELGLIFRLPGITFSKKCSNKKKNKPPCILTFFFRNWLLFDRNLIIGIIKINWTDLIKNFGFLKKHTYTVIHLVCRKEKKKKKRGKIQKKISSWSPCSFCVFMKPPEIPWQTFQLYSSEAMWPQGTARNLLPEFLHGTEKWVFVLLF